MHKKLENEFDQVLRISYPHNYTDLKNEIIGYNITLKITLSERRKKKYIVIWDQKGDLAEDYRQISDHSGTQGPIRDSYRKIFRPPPLTCFERG